MSCQHLSLEHLSWNLCTPSSDCRPAPKSRLKVMYLRVDGVTCRPKLQALFKFNAALRPQRPQGLLGKGSPGRPPPLLHAASELRQALVYDALLKEGCRKARLGCGSQVPFVHEQQIFLRWITRLVSGKQPPASSVTRLSNGYTVMTQHPNARTAAINTSLHSWAKERMLQFCITSGRVRYVYVTCRRFDTVYM